MPSPYEILGVPKDATADEVKAAFRREASKAHPDREGGSGERMAAVNEAYAVLADASRRKHFDQTGSTGQPPSVDDEAVQLLTAMFARALEQEVGGIVEFARDQAHGFQQTLIQQREDALAKARKLEGKRGKVRTKGGASNIVQALIDSQVAALRSQVASLNHQLKVASATCKLLEAYDEDRPPPEQPTFFTMSELLASGAARPGRWF